MNDIDELLKEELEDSAFAKAWEETELEDQIKRLMLDTRLEKNMTQKELSAKSGIRQSNISRIENGVCIPTLTTLNSLAKAMGKKIKITMM